MSKVAIKAENISKAYRLGQIGTGTISKDLERWWAKARGKEDPFLKIGEANDRTVKGNGDVVWSLKDINFEINQGDAVGIIGRNGAGKSTLLKILSKVTSPTTGQITGVGRIASLLEVGTGFHPELTGRENIYLNGAILGMRKAEIKRKFDEIVDFSGVERYIDTPVKRYSSGMYVRLAFAVAAHLESEILIVDEVLAVGDAEFQKKCLGKMGEVSKGEGRTVLFVSHQINSIRALCNKGILLNRGNVEIQGDVNAVVNKYLKASMPSAKVWINDGSFAHNRVLRPLKFSLVDSNLNTLQNTVENDKKIGVVIECELHYIEADLSIGFAIYNSNDQLLFWSYQSDTNPSMWPNLEVGLNRLLCWLPTNFLNEGEYTVEMIASIHYKEWTIPPQGSGPKISFEVKGGLSESPNWQLVRPGICAPILQFFKIE